MLYRILVNLSGQTFVEYTQAEREVRARLNIARRLELRLGLRKGALTSKLLGGADSVLVEPVSTGQTPPLAENKLNKEEQ